MAKAWVGTPTLTVFVGALPMKALLLIEEVAQKAVLPLTWNSAASPVSRLYGPQGMPFSGQLRNSFPPMHEPETYAMVPFGSSAMPAAVQPLNVASTFALVLPSTTVSTRFEVASTKARRPPPNRSPTPAADCFVAVMAVLVVPPAAGTWCTFPDESIQATYLPSAAIWFAV